MVEIVGLVLFGVLVTGLVALWRWADDIARSSAAAGRSEDVDGYRHNGG